MKYASIDIGTNTILMLIGEIDDSLRIEPIMDFYEVPRVGRNVSATKRLMNESMEKGLKVLKNYARIAREYNVERVVASATSAVRDAENRQDFIKLVKDKSGIDVEVIDGSTEAEIGYLGAVSGAANQVEPTLMIDIGGGSTELSYGIGLKPVQSKSIDVGAVRITEKFFVHNPPLDDELARGTEFTEIALTNYPFSEIDPRRIYAVAGTATTLALIAQKKYAFEISAVENFEMSYETLRDIFQDLRQKTASEIRRMTEAAEGRADVLLAGALILMKVLEAAGAAKFRVTDRGLRHGYMIYKHMQLIGR